MLNFPVAAGTSGHLLGGALAAILVGPYTGALCVAVVLLVQGLLFADGGLTALGVNIVTMALVTVVVGYVVFRLLIRVLPLTQGRGHRARRSSPRSSRCPSPRWPSSALYAIGGTADVLARDGRHGDGRRARADRDRRGRHHRASRSGASSPSGPTWSTACATACPSVELQSRARQPRRRLGPEVDA